MRCRARAQRSGGGRVRGRAVRGAASPYLNALAWLLGWLRSVSSDPSDFDGLKQSQWTVFWPLLTFQEVKLVQKHVPIA